MSSELAQHSTAAVAMGGADHQPEAHTVDDEAYEPTYAEAFPPLPNASGDGAAPPPTEGTARPTHTTPPTPWTKKITFKRSVVTQAFTVPVEERRYKEMSEQGFGEKKTNFAICSDIMAKTGVSIEICAAKDKSLTVLITGKSDQVMKARKFIVQELQMQAEAKVAIPKEHHRYLLGTKGHKLAALELDTATKIMVPRMEENSEIVTIHGSKEGIERARHEIQLISDEQAKLAFERLHIPKIYHPFVCGPDNTIVKALMEKTGARISVPPPSVQKDEVVVSGEKDGVHLATQTIMEIYNEKKRKCQTVSVEVRKSQHKYVVGPRGSNLNEILEETGVSVEVPPLDSPSETITLRGEQVKLGPALTMVYSKANSVVVDEVTAPAWLHRFIIGRKGANIKKITEDFPKVHIEFHDGQDKIELEGPPADVDDAHKKLDEIVKDLTNRMSFAEITVDQKYHKHIIGRAGSNVGRIKNETGVSIRIPPDSENSNVIRIEGSPEGVATAKQELVDMVNKMENEKSRDIIIEQRFHKTIIGQRGAKISEIRDKFNQVQITFPEPAKKSDVVTLRGPKNDVDKAHRYLQQMHTELIASNYMAEVHIFKQFHKNIIGKGGANIKKIREETDTKIDLPSENSESDVIQITGKREQVDQAKTRIEAIQKELANIKEIILEIPNKFHNSIIGAKGRLIRSVMEECGGVIIRFPQEGGNSDKVVIRGPTDDVEKAKAQLLDLAAERKDSSFSTEVRCKPEYHKFLIGRGGTNVRKLRESTSARVIFPSNNDADQELITVIGTQESVNSAKKELELRIKGLENIVELQIQVDPKFHRHFVVRRGEVLRQIADDYGGVSVSFPRSGVKSDLVTLKGAHDCVDGAKKRILEIVADLEAQVTVECVISQKYHRTVMGPKGSHVQEITKDLDVGIKFPDRPQDPVEGQQNGQKEQKEETAETAETEEKTGEEATVAVNGDVNGDAPRKIDIIIITGKKENCEKAKEALLALVPITKEVAVEPDFHRRIIGKRGLEVRTMMDEFEVHISIPSPEENSDIIKISGPPANCDRAEQGLYKKVKELEAEREDRMARSFKLEVEVDPSYHPKIIGRKGAVITKIRQDYNVNVQFPERGAENQGVIMITGYEEDTHRAKDAIRNIVKELEDMLVESLSIDHRVHPRIIGSRGRNVRKLMDQFKVDIKFPRPEAEDPNVVVLTGKEEDVMDCKDHLLNIEEELLQDIVDQEVMQQFYHPPSKSSDHGDSRRHNKETGFSVRDAPWSQRPGGSTVDTSNSDDFPEFCGNAPTVHAAPVQWGPRRK